MIGFVKLKNLINDNKLIINVDYFNESKIIKMIPLIKKRCSKNNLSLHFINGSSLLYNLEQIINSKTDEEKYNLIYDCVCDYLDNELNTHNYCKFIDNKCIANRLGYSVHNINGCCYERGKGLCDKLINNKCSIRNTSCKFFTCIYLEKKGVKFKPNDIVQVKYFLNYKQKNIITRNFFKTKEEIIKLLIKYK